MGNHAQCAGVPFVVDSRDVDASDASKPFVGDFNPQSLGAFVVKPRGLFTDVVRMPADPILNTAAMYDQDTDPTKINLAAGAYRTEEGKPYVLPVVRKAEAETWAETRTNKLDKECSPIDGPPALKTLAQELCFGAAANSLSAERVASVQTLSGTGALRLCGEFALMHLQPSSHAIYVSEPAWGNHAVLFEKCGLTVTTYPYWNEKTQTLDFQAMTGKLAQAAPGSMVLLQACAHNPTGMDLTEFQWRDLLETLRIKHFIPIIDCSYQGFASGDLDRDALAIRVFDEAELEFFVTQSFAKNMGLYGERIGMLHVVCASKDRAEVVLSHLKAMIRPMYSSPPVHGARLVVRILGNPNLCAEWKRELQEMVDRLVELRRTLRSGLEAKGTPGEWKHITEQVGMFACTGLSTVQCERLIHKHHIYLLTSGRISLAGLNHDNISRVVDAVDEVVRAFK
mmetsp:Transcript_51459/g.143868  ORF Transcript_51459/g.143868 Transcript_51459/m.143868 type:complete len:454 (+) Transcript_51459:85-1446(+)